MPEKAYIVLENGQIFCGKRFGYSGDGVGELVFTTGMGGYIELLTDPASYGQIILQNFPQIGNYGIIKEDFESKKATAAGFIVRDLCCYPSNFRCEYDLDTFLKEQKIPGVYDIDTRELAKTIREHGTMVAKIVSEIYDGIENDIKGYTLCDAVKAVTADKIIHYGSADKKYNVAVLDLGVKKSVIDCLTSRGADVDVFPAYTKAGEIIGNYDGLVIAGGPGAPDDVAEIAEEIKKLFGKLPIFGICLGHLVLAMALGAKTEKLKYGHRGENQPVTDVKSGRVYITSQNHGYAVLSDSLMCGEISYINTNDKSCEGIEYENAFSVQFHPEGCAGPKDTEFLFDKFTLIMGGNKNA